MWPKVVRRGPVQGGICHGLGSPCAVADRRATDGITDCAAVIGLVGTSLASAWAFALYVNNVVLVLWSHTGRTLVVQYVPAMW
ncbi:hypothetical protein RRF57_001101 [Xylaria bambusicola]|uniref:Uncharacterized protein n=1 Tax=Xylaria bambusicola TaxID=326684 RepID=A0AAN7YUP7_9PEZI